MKKYFIVRFFFLINCNKNENMNLIFNEVQINDGTKIKTIDLTDQEYKNILEKESKNLKRLFNSITIEDSSIIIYEISEGNILVSSDGYHSVYKNIEDLHKVINDYDSNGIEILLNINIYGDKFPNFTNHLIVDLYSSLIYEFKKNESHNLDVLCNKISKIDNVKKFNKDKFLNYIALIGEMILSQYDGKWEMKLSNDKTTWNPYLIVNGSKIDIVSYLNEDVIEGNKDIKLTFKSINDIINLRDVNSTTH